MASHKTLYALVLSGLFILTNCSVEKNTSSTRFYHSLTSRYNIYFNGHESFKAGLEKIRYGYTDDFGGMLKVFEYSDPATVSMASSDMEQAIQKASKVINLKSITAKPDLNARDEISEKDRDFMERKEFNSWVDDSYLLIAKARFYKHEFDEATALFNYIITSANEPSIRTESSIWLARIYNETGNLNESERILSEIEPSALVTKALKGMYNTTNADLLIKQKKYSDAAEALDKSLDFVSGKITKYRLTYLLAQLYELSGQPSKANLAYRQVIKKNPPYEVEFNARIKLAGVFDVSSGNPQEIRKELEKMLKDSKNNDFHDQIYFAMGNMSMKAGNENEALDFYRKSATAVSPNQNQKGRSYLALANYYYDRSDFMRAGIYYDSSVYFLDQKNPDFLMLREKSQDLNILVSELKIIQHEDSLQKVAGMSEPERNVLIASIIADISRTDNAGSSSDYSDRYNVGQYYENERRFQNNIEQEGKWYFYNQAALTFGRTEFRRRWGERRLEDNWRRSNKARATSSQITAGTEEINPDINDTSQELVDNRQPAFYLKNLPLSDSLISISNQRIANALLNAGNAYSERIGDDLKATSSFEALISRFPTSHLVPEALYSLYKVNRDLNSIRAESFRQRLLQNHPESEYARILSDPEYYNNKIAELNVEEKLYQSAYTAYTNENFSDALTLCNDALSKFGDDHLTPKFMLLKAYSIARLRNEREFKESLADLIKRWPDTEESKKAVELIAFLNQKMPELKIEEDKVIASELYVADTTSSHLFVMIIPDPSFNVNQGTFDVISYNIDNYTNKNFRTEGTLVDNKYIMITVAGFSDYSQALNYFRSFNPEGTIRNPSGARITSFIITNGNLRALNSDKKPERYIVFFNQNYPVN